MLFYRKRSMVYLNYIHQYFPNHVWFICTSKPPWCSEIHGPMSQLSPFRYGQLRSQSSWNLEWYWTGKMIVLSMSILWETLGNFSSSPLKDIYTKLYKKEGLAKIIVALREFCPIKVNCYPHSLVPFSEFYFLKKKLLTQHEDCFNF